MTIPPDVTAQQSPQGKYADLFKELYKEARDNKRGLWKNINGTFLYDGLSGL